MAPFRAASSEILARSVRPLLSPILLLLLVCSCIKRTTTSELIGIPPLPDGVGQRVIEMEGCWEVRGAQVISLDTPLPPDRKGQSNTDFFRLPLVGSRVVIGKESYVRASGRSMAKESVATPGVETKRFFNLRNGSYAVFRLEQEATSPSAVTTKLSFWLVAGSVSEGRMIARIRYESTEPGARFAGDWYLDLRRVSSSVCELAKPVEPR